jgi:hypothetical protein
MGYPDEVTDALALLTHEDGVPYMDYVEKISHNATAKKVKLADLRHNSDLTRLSAKEIDEYALQRTEKYKKAIKFLEEHQ